jgi:hypothetical protein
VRQKACHRERERERGRHREKDGGGAKRERRKLHRPASIRPLPQEPPKES